MFAPNISDTRLLLFLFIATPLSFVLVYIILSVRSKIQRGKNREKNK